MSEFCRCSFGRAQQFSRSQLSAPLRSSAKKGSVFSVRASAGDCIRVINFVFCLKPLLAIAGKPVIGPVISLAYCATFKQKMFSCASIGLVSKLNVSWCIGDANGSRDTTYAALENLQCDLSGFPDCSFFRVEVCRKSL